MPASSSLRFQANKTSQEIFSAFKQGKRVIFIYNNNYQIPKTELQYAGKNQQNYDSNESNEYIFADKYCFFSSHSSNDYPIGVFNPAFEEGTFIK